VIGFLDGFWFWLGRAAAELLIALGVLIVVIIVFAWLEGKK
jgi:hypothetical protein